MKKFLDFAYFKKDLLGGITAGIVALPLALAFGEQSGLGAATGLYGAAFIAFFAALFGGTPTQISGPTAPMTALSMVVVAALLQTYEGKLELALPMILLVFLMAGVFQILFGIIKIGGFIKYIPYTVLSGFMSGIGIIILITQILPALGYNVATDEEVIESFMPYSEELILERILAEEAEDGVLVIREFNKTIKRANDITYIDIRKGAKVLAINDALGVFGSLKYIKRALSGVNYIELILSLLTIILIFGFKKITKTIPSTLIALVLISGSAYFLGLEYVPIREIPAGYPMVHFDIFTETDFRMIVPFILSAVMLALLGTIDSLLTSVVADNLTKTQHNPNRELIGQGIGNSVAAIFGGLPGAGATIRTVVNIQAGGVTKISGMISGLLLFVIILMLGPLASNIPAAVLAGILITVGIGVMDYKGLMAMPRMEVSDRAILLTVLALTIFWQLVYAVGIGLILAAILFLKRMSDVSARRVLVSSLEQQTDVLWEDEVEVLDKFKNKVIFKHLDGPMFFGIAAHFRSVASEIGDIHLLVLRMEKVPFIDQSGVHALEHVIEDLQRKDVMIVISGMTEQANTILKNMNVIPQMIPKEHVFKHFAECRIWLREVLSDEGRLEMELNHLKK